MVSENLKAALEAAFSDDGGRDTSDAAPLAGGGGGGFAMGVSGYSGAGKTTAALAAADALEAATGLEVERCLVDSNCISDTCLDDSIEIAVVDGIKSAGHIRSLGKHYAAVTNLFIDAPPLVRLARLNDGRESDEYLSRDALEDRDHRDATRGLGRMEAHSGWNYRIVNEDLTESEFKRVARSAARGFYTYYND